MNLKEPETTASTRRSITFWLATKTASFTLRPSSNFRNKMSPPASN